MSNIRSAMVILPEIRDGRAVEELSDQIHAAIAAVREHGKPATVKLEITIAPLRKGAENLVEAPFVFVAETTSKLPKPDAEATAFFIDADGNATRQPASRQGGLELKVGGNAAEQKT